MGAEGTGTTSRPRPRETLLPCRHAASPRPQHGGGFLRGRCSLKGQGGEGSVVAVTHCLASWPLKQSLTSGEGWG